MQGECRVCRGINNNLNKNPNMLIRTGFSENYVCDICIDDYAYNPVVAIDTVESIAYFKAKQGGKLRVVRNYVNDLLKKYGRRK